MRSILLYGCETWPARVVDESMLAVFDNDIIRRILHLRHRYCVLKAELRRRLRPTRSKEGFVGLVMPQVVPAVNESWNYFCPR